MGYPDGSNEQSRRTRWGLFVVSLLALVLLATACRTDPPDQSLDIDPGSPGADRNPAEADVSADASESARRGSGSSHDSDQSNPRPDGTGEGQEAEVGGASSDRGASSEQSGTIDKGPAGPNEAESAEGTGSRDPEDDAETATINEEGEAKNDDDPDPGEGHQGGEEDGSGDSGKKKKPLREPDCETDRDCTAIEPDRCEVHGDCADGGGAEGGGGGLPPCPPDQPVSDNCLQSPGTPTGEIDNCEGSTICESPYQEKLCQIADCSPGESKKDPCFVVGGCPDPNEPDGGQPGIPPQNPDFDTPLPPFGEPLPDWSNPRPGEDLDGGGLTYDGGGQTRAPCPPGHHRIGDNCVETVVPSDP